MIPIDMPGDMPELVSRPLEMPSLDTALGWASQPSAVPPLSGRVELGGPHAARITQEWAAEDRDLLLFVTEEAGRFVYHLVRFTLHFPAQPPTPYLDSVRAQVELAASGSAEPPVVWSMMPAAVADVRQRERRWGLGQRLQLVELGQTVTDQVQQPYLTGVGEQTPRAEWTFTRTRARRLVGGHPLAMVVRVPAGVTATLGLEITAATRGRVRRRYRHLPDPLTLPAPYSLP